MSQNGQTQSVSDHFGALYIMKFAHKNLHDSLEHISTIKTI